MFESMSVLVFPWVIALMITPLLERMAHARGWVDRPTERKRHKRPTPYVGGFAVFGAMGIGLALASLVYPPVSVGFWGGASISVLGLGIVSMLALGVVDDQVDLRPGVKLTVQILVASVTWVMGFRVGAVELPLDWIVIDATVPSFVLTVAWIVMITNAMNLIDGLDGLSSGIGLIAMLTIFMLATEQREAVPAIACLALAGALAGFLRFNLPPARLFLGDSGALAVGYTASVVSIATYQKSSAAMVIALPLLALALPLLDVGLAILRRGIAHVRANGIRGVRVRSVVRAVFQADRGHIHHLLLRSGWSVNRILLVLYGLCAFFAFMAVGLAGYGSTVRWGVVALSGVLGLIALRRLERRVARIERQAEIDVEVSVLADKKQRVSR